jgi:tRNA(His) guanylyltransferase
MQRMKANYESRSRTFLTRRTPVIIRLDGKAFHTYTRGLDKPFDESLIEDMQETAIYLCENIQGAKCAYVQSDEISILITDYDALQTQAWFDYNVQKIVSISASYATGRFNQLRYQQTIYKDSGSESDNFGNKRSYEVVTCDLNIPMAHFDSRVFNIPKEEISNYFLARQKDAVKNSIIMVAQSLYSHKELHEKNSNEMQEMCFQKGCNWNDLHFSKKRGSFIIKNTYWNNEIVQKVNTFDDICDPTYELRTDSLVYYDNGNIFLNGDGDEVAVIIKSKWEVIETPLVFSDSNFKEWL